MLLTDFPLHVAIFDGTSVEVVLVVLMMAITAHALYPRAGRHYEDLVFLIDQNLAHVKGKTHLCWLQ